MFWARCELSARMPDPWSLTQLQKLQNAELLKQQAAAFMKAQEFRRACVLRLGRLFRSVSVRFGIALFI